MKKKRPQFELDKKKTVLLVTVVLAIGIFLLALSILFSPQHLDTENSKLKQKKSPYAEQPKDVSPEKKDNSFENSKAPVQSNKKEIIPKPEPASQDLREPDVLKPRIPSESKNRDIVLVFDDAGNNLSQLQKFIDLPFPVTIAVLPQLTYSAESARRIRLAGKEVFLHQPMQALDKTLNPGPGAILPSMNSNEITQQLKANIAQIAPIKGMNNHEGSLITSDRYIMGVVLDVCCDEDIIFLDSRTNAKSVVFYSSIEREFPVLERDIFIDNSANKKDMQAMIEEGLIVADKKGYVVMIGHVFNHNLADLLNDIYPILKMEGYDFITASQLYKKIYK
ncbi:MAG TPA: divergent polysaccharide deacetylase family protein [Treponemataceae bacterium]|nr:divergent polysaccharide deacetylase family protein [Treponemataceae bacterium]